MNEPTTNDSIQTVLTSLERTFQDRRQAVERWLAEIKPERVSYCSRHEKATDLDGARSYAASLAAGAVTLIYSECPECQREKRLDGEDKRLNRQGVPAILCHATLDNFKPTTQRESTAVTEAKKFIRRGKGFLILLGAIGRGKSHLAAAVLRAYKSGLFIKQSTLLYKLRESYGNPKAENIMETAKQAKLLVIDELGLSVGGKDEFPMLHEILDYRHGELKPTVLTGNLTPDELVNIIGPRLQDRLEQSTFAVITFEGSSHRANMFQTTND